MIKISIIASYNNIYPIYFIYIALKINTIIKNVKYMYVAFIHFSTQSSTTDAMDILTQYFLISDALAFFDFVPFFLVFLLFPIIIKINNT